MLNEELARGFIESLYEDVAFLLDPDVEQKMVCTLDCCFGNETMDLIEHIVGFQEGLFTALIARKK